MNKQRYFILSILSIVLPLLLGATIYHDPTEPPGFQGAESAKNPFGLSAIFIYPHQRFAIINGVEMEVGNHLGEYIITTITPNTVELTGNGNKIEVLQLITSVKQAR